MILVFLSHPKESQHPELANHLEAVAERTKTLLESAGFKEKANDGFYCGLLHDVGKLNPFYQKLFNTEEPLRKEIRNKLSNEFYPGHSWFSTLIAKRALPLTNQESAEHILMSIAGHHTRLSKLTRTSEHYKQANGKYKPLISKTLQDIKKNVDLFETETKNNKNLSNLDWKKCETRLLYFPVFNDYFPKQENNSAFIETSVLFSSLLQADRGSFHKQQNNRLSFNINTNKLVKHESALTKLRSEFQKTALEKMNFSENMTVLEAPTGIGKTKVFLDTINYLKEKHGIERAFYFSPLLALTDDFEEKLKEIVSEKNLEKILTYNHVFTGTLAEKNNKQENDETYKQDIFSNPETGRIWFEQESFSKEFIVTTMQRFIITLFSNNQSDKMKLLSFKNSLLILDEVQTLPKFLLPSMVSLINQMSKKMNFKVLLVSATIPHELLGLPKISCPETTKQQYLTSTQKRILFLPKLNIEEISKTVKEQKTLIMLNTRKKCITTYSSITDKRSFSKPYYLSSGVRKKTRQERIQKIKKNKTVLVVSTQVLEAGVDTSFFSIYRELAPLDNIVQVLGRLDREGNYNGKGVLTIFKIDQGNYWTPYPELEVKETEKLLSEEQTTEEIYKKLEIYYKNVSEKNLKNKNKTEELETEIKRCNFDEVWKIVQKTTFPEDDRETVIIPENESQWQEIYNFFTNPKDKKKTKIMELTASLPGSIHKLGIQDLFVPEILEKNILLPKYEKIGELYDEEVGLDKWLKK